MASGTVAAMRKNSSPSRRGGVGDAPGPRPAVRSTLGQEGARPAEAVEAEPGGVPRGNQRAVPDQSGAEQRRGLRVGIPRRDGKAESLIRDGVLGVAAVELIAGEPGKVA